ncbi:M15 family metallopeptidase [Amycolatopsis sp. NPDC051758]|uniref:M15 family metallopeptidase n=1 Tax=Amycolatopsis sp. NPDC051758 TaxID=3363935 RepID=UPI0037AFF957
MIARWSDPRIARVPIRDCGEPLVDVRASAPLSVAGPPVHLRYGVVERLVTAQSLLPRTVRLLIVDGHRPATRPTVAPHPTGGAVDITLSDRHAVDPAAATLPTCCTGIVPPPADRTRQMLTSALTAVGLVAYPTRWWHWSYGDRYWAFVTQAAHSRYGPLPDPGATVTGGRIRRRSC